MTTREDLLDTAPCGLATFTDDGTIRFANRTLASLLDYDRDELIGRPFETLLTVPTRIFCQTHFFPLITLHGRADEIYFSLRSNTGSSIPVFANATRGDYEGSAANHCVFLPLYQRERYEDELLNAKRAAESALRKNVALMEEAETARAHAEAANRAKSVFLSTMSHEIRTPINAIIGYSQLLETEPGGQVTVECGAAGEDRLFVRVTDTGVGIPAESLESVFDPFVQVQSGSTHTTRGTGLGLAISRRFARLMGGDLNLTSELGKGSSFILTLRRGI